MAQATGKGGKTFHPSLDQLGLRQLSWDFSVIFVAVVSDCLVAKS